MVGDNPRDLMKLARDGDAAGFGKIYTEYFTPVYRYVFVRVRERTLAEDLTQTVFMKAFATIEHFQEQGRAPLAYFFTIARNAITDHWRKKKDLHMTDVEDVMANIVDSNPGPKEMAEQREAADQVSALLSTLPEEQKDIIALRFMGDLSHKEIADLVGKNEATVRQIQSRALRTIREKLGDLNGI